MPFFISLVLFFVPLRMMVCAGSANIFQRDSIVESASCPSPHSIPPRHFSPSSPNDACSKFTCERNSHSSMYCCRLDCVENRVYLISKFGNELHDCRITYILYCQMGMNGTCVALYIHFNSFRWWREIHSFENYFSPDSSFSVPLCPLLMTGIPWRIFDFDKFSFFPSASFIHFR